LGTGSTLAQWQYLGDPAQYAHTAERHVRQRTGLQTAGGAVRTRLCDTVPHALLRRATADAHAEMVRQSAEAASASGSPDAGALAEQYSEAMSAAAAADAASEGAVNALSAYLQGQAVVAGAGAGGAATYASVLKAGGVSAGAPAAGGAAAAAAGGYALYRQQRALQQQQQRAQAAASAMASLRAQVAGSGGASTAGAVPGAFKAQQRTTTAVDDASLAKQGQQPAAQEPTQQLEGPQEPPLAKKPRMENLPSQ
jgi:hypothetical protein